MSDDFSESLIEKLDSLLERAQAGEIVDISPLCQEYPAQAAEIRGLWATALVAEDVAILETLLGDGELQIRSPNTEIPLRLGDYEILEELGRGGMGIVYRARQKSLNRTVAVKMLLRGKLESEANLARFASEARSAARLDHPHIVAVHDVGEENGHHFFSMPLIDGETLATRISQNPLGPQEAARLLIPVCRAVAYAHQNGILHRDLKPSNILIDLQGRPFVSDFGLAKRFPIEGDGASNSGSLTESGAILGTPGYMAPEQAAGSKGMVDRSTDIYSLGAILYACVTGRAPFQAATPVDAILMILEQDPPPPRLLNPRIDPDLEMIILKALQKPQDLRYQPADALATDLEAFLNHEAVSARSSQFTQVLSRAFRPTHHVGVMENWGVLWMWHSLVLLVLCLTTDWIKSQGVESRLPYFLLWTVGLGTWALIFWNLRRRSGPVTFVERQIAHVWAASMACSTGLFAVEGLLGLPVLTLSPVLALIAAGVFVAKAGILSGEFYLSSVVLYLTVIPMAWFPEVGVSIFGVVSALSFFLPGWKFHSLRKRNNRSSIPAGKQADVS
ncbi:MAG: serine/threonine protein kinase [Planctomycetaceae bacterium]|nr:serine/threonine protein kinase [Planctomycetaceae bacterium]